MLQSYMAALRRIKTCFFIVDTWNYFLTSCIYIANLSLPDHFHEPIAVPGMINKVIDERHHFFSMAVYKALEFPLLCPGYWLCKISYFIVLKRYYYRSG